MTGTYELLDSGDQWKLERFGNVTLLRPCSHAVWRPSSNDLHGRADAVFERGRDGTGEWNSQKRVPEAWDIQFSGLTWQVRPNDHGNVGIFPEQRDNWAWLEARCTELEARGLEPEVLNLFGYTGGSSLVAARGRARVVHVDASKTSVLAARENAERSGLDALPIRWIVEDAARFVEREIRRGRKYRGIVLDPPSYGRGPKGEIWQIERDMVGLVERTRELLEDGPSLFCLTSHSPGFSPIVLEHFSNPPGDSERQHGEMTIDSDETNTLPAGAFSRWCRR